MEKEFTWKKKKTFFFEEVFLIYWRFYIHFFFSPFPLAPSQVFTLVCSFSHSYSREIREIPITKIFS